MSVTGFQWVLHGKRHIFYMLFVWGNLKSLGMFKGVLTQDLFRVKCSIAQMFHRKQWMHWTECGSSAVLYNLKVSLKSKERKSWIFCSVDHWIVQTMQFNSHVCFNLKLVPLCRVIYHLCVATWSSGGKEKHHYKHHTIIIFWWKSCTELKVVLISRCSKTSDGEEHKNFLIS